MIFCIPTKMGNITFVLYICGYSGIRLFFTLEWFFKQLIYSRNWVYLKAIAMLYLIHFLRIILISFQTFKVLNLQLNIKQNICSVRCLFDIGFPGYILNIEQILILNRILFWLIFVWYPFPDIMNISYWLSNIVFSVLYSFDILFWVKNWILSGFENIKLNIKQDILSHSETFV